MKMKRLWLCGALGAAGLLLGACASDSGARSDTASGTSGSAATQPSGTAAPAPGTQATDSYGKSTPSTGSTGAYPGRAPVVRARVAAATR